MKRGFTLIEMMIALSIAAVMLAAILGLLTSVWMLSKESSDDLQLALHARAVRERLFYGLTDASGDALPYGLTSATNILCSKSEIIAYMRSGETWSVRTIGPKSDGVVQYGLDSGKEDADFSDGKAPLQFLYLKLENGKGGEEGVKRPGYVAYYDRLVVPVFGRHPTDEDIDACFVNERK